MIQNCSTPTRKQTNPILGDAFKRISLDEGKLSEKIENCKNWTQKFNWQPFSGKTTSKSGGGGVQWSFGPSGGAKICESGFFTISKFTINDYILLAKLHNTIAQSKITIFECFLGLSSLKFH